MATLILTQQETLLQFELDESQVEMVKADVGGSYIERSVPHNTGYNGNPLFVTETLSDIAQQAESLIPLNISKTGDQYTSVLLNGSVNHFGAIQANDPLAPNGISRFEYFHNGSTMEIYLAQESKATIGALLQQIENGSNNPIVTTITGNVTLTAAELATGCLNATGAGGYAITLPSATDLAAKLNAKAGSVFNFVLTNNSAGAAGILPGLGMQLGNISPGATVSGEAQACMIVFVSTTSATISRIL